MKYVKIILRNKDEILQHYFLKAEKWDLPAGRIEEGETGAHAAQRELFERTGYEILEEKLILKNRIIENEHEFFIFEGVVADAKQTAEPGEKGGYSTKIRWSKDI